MARDYSVPDDITGNTYLIRIKSEKENDWTIDVYGDDLYTLIETYAHHNFLEIPKRLRGTILLEIGRGQKNIIADKAHKSDNKKKASNK